MGFYIIQKYKLNLTNKIKKNQLYNTIIEFYIV
jgi:hypothetical protein